MFKGFKKAQQFNGFPNLNFQVNNEAYGYSGCTFWLDASYGLNTQTNLAAVSSWQSKIGNVIFTQSTAANQFVYYDSVLSFNNYPCVFYGTGTKFMTIQQAVGFSKNWTIVIIGQRTATIAQFNVVMGSFGSSSSLVGSDGFYFGGNFSASITGIGLYSNATKIVASTIEDTNAHISVINNNECVVDGVVYETGDFRSPAAINALGFAGIPNFGYLAEVIIFNNKIDGVTLCNRLNQKYAIY